MATSLLRLSASDIALGWRRTHPGPTAIRIRAFTRAGRARRGVTRYGGQTRRLPAAAFGPPTWAVLVFFRLESNLSAVPLVAIGALAAASGRLVLAYGSRRFRGRLSEERIRHLEAARDALTGGRKRAIGGLGVFALSPVPSAQLFVAAGLVAAPLVPLTAAFFAGRIISYTIYVSAASAARHSFGSILESSFRSPLGIGLQLAMLAGLVLLLKLDWAHVLSRGLSRHGQHGSETPGQCKA